MKAKIIYQETYIQSTLLYIDFEYDNTKYTARAYYLNGCNIEDVEVLEYDTAIEILDSDPIFVIGQDLLENMDIKKHITF
jgi:hypothetical protein